LAFMLTISAFMFSLQPPLKAAAKSLSFRE
jgi:hypothetical protein